jgi:hypothetical protein
MTTSPAASSDNELLPYREVTDPTYTQLVAQNFTLDEPEPGILVLRGSCPRCSALLEIPAVGSIFQGMRSINDIFGRRRPIPPSGTHVEPMICTCEDEHPNRPEGRTGCGAYWTLLIPTSPR